MMCELILGQFAEAIFIPIFIIIAKKLKTKRILFLISMITEYFILKYLLPYNIMFQVLLPFMTYVILKMLYGRKTQITDIFLYLSSMIVIILSTIIAMIPTMILGQTIIFTAIVSRIILILFIIVFRNKIGNIYSKYYNNWNRKQDQKIRSLTVRNISIITFNFIFYFINLTLVYKTIIDKLIVG